MKIPILVIAVILLILFNFISINTFGNSEVGKYSDPISDSRLLNNNQISKSNAFPAAPNHFTENRGHLENNEIRFYDQGGVLWFTADGVWFEVRDELPISSQQSTVLSRELETRGQGSQLRGQGVEWSMRICLLILIGIFGKVFIN